MSKIIFVGTVEGPHPNQVTEREFDELHARLLTIPESKTVAGLAERLGKTATAHLWTVSNRQPIAHQYITAAEHIVSSIGQEELELHQERRQRQYFGLGWLLIARSSLSESALHTGIGGEVLAESVFFETDREKRAKLDRLVLGAFKPYGTYEHYSLAAGIALGEVTSRPFGDTSPD